MLRDRKRRRRQAVARSTVFAALALGLITSASPRPVSLDVRSAQAIDGGIVAPVDDPAGNLSQEPKAKVKRTPKPGASLESSALPPWAASLTPHPRGFWVEVPAIGVDAQVVNLGLSPDGTLEVPQEYDVAGWYSLGPRPGEVGPAVIVGHVDSYKGAAVFYRVRDLEPGMTVAVWRGGKPYSFVITQVSQYPKDAFPTDKVYGSVDYPALRLITCGGVFNDQTGHYTDNIVVFAKQQG